ncbi:LOW QUALITY PROTEIN: hypothetical protein PHMEG_00019071 [Phytophthora megakarya]|uniref:Uncharacterized protein n=1 Tax=Phytophthora megakarya TaxID=4795 RepID=A0A225VU03_9STRA|nr:LOW QUALITY PROTEIN: hypothetical protein PHMEG_00019071 [Phytophthora megakarya]
MCRDYRVSSRSGLAVTLTEPSVKSHVRRSIRRYEDRSPAGAHGRATRVQNSTNNTPEAEDDVEQVSEGRGESGSNVPDCLPSDNSPSDKSQDKSSSEI